MSLFIVAAVVISLASLFIGKISIFFIGIMFLSLGHLLISFLSDRANKRVYYRIYNITFIAYALYALACRLYMIAYDYDCLLVTDTITAYIPYTEDFLKMNSFSEMWNAIYGPSGEYKYEHVGVITIYFAAVGKIMEFFDNELYFNLQLSIIFLSSSFSVFLYKLLKGFEISNAYKLTFIYSFVSIFFFYSSFILRDAPIAMLYCLFFCYVFDFSNKHKSLIVFILCITLTFLLRPQMGIFMFSFIAIPFIKQRFAFVNIIIILVFVFIANYIANEYNFYEIYEETMMDSETRLQEVAANSTLNSLNSLPFGISQLAKLIFVQMSPIPCWDYIKVGEASTNVNNIMGIPRAVAVFYNYVVLVFVGYSAFNYKRMQFNNKIIIAFFIVIIFLILQSDTTEQRRMMSCYPILLVISALCYQKINKQTRVILLRNSVILFLMMQVIGMTKYL